MTKREEIKIVKANQRKLHLKTWAEEKARGVSLPFFVCRGLAGNDITVWGIKRLAVVMQL